MAPPETKSRLPVRVSRSSSDEKSSGNDVKEQEKRPKKKPSKILTAVSRRGNGNQSLSSDGESKRTNNNLQIADSGLSLKPDGHKSRGNFFKKTVRKVLRSLTPTRQKNANRCPRKETNSTNAAQSRSCNQPQSELAKCKKLFPRETKASVLRKQSQLEKQKAAPDKKKAKSAIKASSAASEHRGVKYELKIADGEVKTGAEFVVEVAGDQTEFWESRISLPAEIKEGEKDKDAAPQILVKSPDKDVWSDSSSESVKTPSSDYDQLSSDQTVASDTADDISKLEDLPWDDTDEEEVVGTENCVITDDAVQADAVIGQDRDDLEAPSAKDAIKEEQIESGQSPDSYSDGSLGKASSSNAQQTLLQDSDVMASANEDNGRVTEEDADCLLLRRTYDAGGGDTDSDVGELEENISQCESQMEFSADLVENGSAPYLVEYRAESSQNKARSFVDSDSDSLDKTLVALSCQASESVKSTPMTETKDCGSQEEIIEVFDEPKLGSVEDTSNGMSCKNENSLTIDKTNTISADPEMFHIPLSSKKIVQCDSKTGHNMRAEGQLAEVMDNGNNMHEPVCADGWDGVVEEAEVKTVQCRLSQDPPYNEADLESMECRHQALDLPLNNQQLVPALSVSRVDGSLQDNPCTNAEGAASPTSRQEGAQAMEFELNSSGPVKASDWAMSAAINEPCRSTEVTVHSPPNFGVRRETEIEEEALAAEIEKLRKLHAKMDDITEDDIREAFSGKKNTTEVEKGATEISGSSSRVMMLQSVKNIVCSLVQASDDLHGGMQKILEDSALQIDFLQKEMIQMNKQHLQELDEREVELQSLAAYNEQLILQLEEMEEEKITTACFVSNVTMQKQEVCEAAIRLEEELKISQAESDKLKNELEELRREHFKEDTSLVKAFNEETSEVKSLKEEISRLKIQLEGSEENRREKGELLESVSLRSEALSGRVHRLEEELANSQRQRNELQMKMEAVQVELLRERQLASLTDELRRNMIHCEEAERALDCAELEKQKLKDEIKVRRRDLREYQIERQQLEIQIDQMNREMLPFTTNANHVVDDKTHLCGKVNLLQGAPAQSELKPTRKASCDDKLSEAHRERMEKHQLRKLLQAIEKEIVDLKAWNKSLRNYYEGAKITLKQKDSELQQAKNCVEEAFLVLESYRGLLVEQNAKIVALERKLERKGGAIEINEERDAVKRFERKSHAQEKSERKSVEEERAELRKLLENKEKEIAELNTDVISYKNHFEDAKIALKQKDSELQRTKKYVEEKDRELKHVSDLLINNDTKIARLESSLEEKERDIIKINEELEAEDEKSKRYREKSEAEKIDLRKTLEDKERKIMELESYNASLKNCFEGAKISLRQKDNEAEKFKACIEENDKEVERAKLMLRRIDEEKKLKFGCLEMFIARLEEDFERMCISMPVKDSALQQGESSDVKNPEMEKVEANSPEAESPIKECSLSQDEEDEGKCRLKEANRFLKENVQRLEAIIRLQRTERHYCEDVVKMRDKDLTQRKEPFENCRREAENVKCLLAVKERQAASLRRILSEKEQAANKLHTNFQRKLEDLCSLRTELNFVKIENVTMGVKRLKMEKRLKDLDGMARTESDFSLMKLRTALGCVRPGEQNEDGKEMKNVAYCTDGVTEELHGPTYKHTVPLHKTPISISS